MVEHGSVKEEDWMLQETEKPGGMTLSDDSLAQKEASIHSLKVGSTEANELIRAFTIYIL